ncbi:MAG TPA: helix-turn-helix transcriptional regulator [Polyangiaceae bacterium]|nr:helix-turn-helix transcriptional regulator [Polyangiaceae bacterium]
MSFGAEVRRRRLALGMTLDDLAERSGLSAHYLSTVENDHRDPRLSTVIALSQAVRAAPAELLVEGAAPSNPGLLALFETAPKDAQKAVMTVLKYAVAAGARKRQIKRRARRSKR